ncbi:uncharacterized protein VNE69_01189 [Vairimorpha necatrix]|uniref:Uncharacterized protein n=1 Tax=Vairimorpha necatrix TaxID=6039 RepID=A0AAX4J8D6_9MICR
MEVVNKKERYFNIQNENDEDDCSSSISIEDGIENIKNEYEIPVLGSDKLIDLKRLTDIFTVLNSNVLLNVDNVQGIWRPLRKYLSLKGEPEYRSAKNILLAYKYIMMDNKERTRLTNFFSNPGYYMRYENFSYKCGLTVNTLKNYSGYIGTARWKSNILACLMLCKRFGNKRTCSV